MSLLWKTAIAVHVADPRTISRIQNGPKEIPATEAGFKSHVWGTPFSGFWDHTHDPSQIGPDTQERLWDDTAKEPRPQSLNEFGDPNTAHEESHARRFDNAAGGELHKRDLNQNDELHSFLYHHATNKDLWDKTPTDNVDLSQPIHATQPYVLKEHLLRYLHNPNSTTDHVNRNIGAPTHYDRDPDGNKHPYYRTNEVQHDPRRQQDVADYYGNKQPGFVVHNGKMHCVEGHHRVSTALLRGDKSIQGKVYNADAHGFPPAPDDDDE